jgi:hypothetical protein
LQDQQMTPFSYQKFYRRIHSEQPSIKELDQDIIKISYIPDNMQISCHISEDYRSRKTMHVTYDEGH